MIQIICVHLIIAAMLLWLTSTLVHVRGGRRRGRWKGSIEEFEGRRRGILSGGIILLTTGTNVAFQTIQFKCTHLITTNQMHNINQMCITYLIYYYIYLIIPLRTWLYTIWLYYHIYVYIWFVYHTNHI